jgi:hypothetical protein
LSCLDEESFDLEDQLWKAVIEGVGNYLIVWGLCLCNSVIVNTRPCRWRPGSRRTPHESQRRGERLVPSAQLGTSSVLA